ncbi:hypothetical protein PMAYCL1PPCAC_09047, partial [Pristionchus mayeri]
MALERFASLGDLPITKNMPSSFVTTVIIGLGVARFLSSSIGAGRKYPPKYGTVSKLCRRSAPSSILSLQRQIARPEWFEAYQAA